MRHLPSQLGDTEEERAYIERTLAAFEAPRKESYQTPDEATIRSWIEDANSAKPYPNDARRLDNETLQRFAEELSRETDPQRQRKYLRLFWNRAFPLEPEPVLALARASEEKLARSAVLALCLIRHPKVRALAEEWMHVPEQSHLIPWLLVSDPQSGDSHLFLELLARSWSDEDYHTLALAIREYTEANLSMAQAPVLWKPYEEGLCSLCRYSIIELLQKLGALPDEVTRECRYDADSDTRCIVEKTLLTS